VDGIAPRDQLFDREREKMRAGKRKVEGPAPATPGSPELAPPRQTGNPAPPRAYEIINKTLSISPDESLRMELDAIVDLGKKESTQNLIRNFFLAEKYKKGSPDAPPEKVKHAAVIGAGVMGSGIAQWLSSRGVTVILRDIGREQIDRGLANIEKTYAGAVKRGLMTEEKAKQGRARICGSTAPMELRDVRFVIEAASEKMNIKKEVFRELAMEAGPKTIIATNTSALPVTELADVTVSPEHVIGMHFFNPVSRMKLVEVVIAKQTSDETLARAYGKRDYGSAVLLWLRDQQMLGHKTGAGFYKYEGKTNKPNESLMQLRVVAGGGDPGRGEGSTKSQPGSSPPATDVDIAHRLVFLMVNEAARCVEEKVVDSPEDADYGMILGTGFAPFRGGPLRFAEHFGLKKVVDELDRLARTEEKFSACEILKKHARDGTKFYES